jgi:GNAT superfamily N-acetyltransferase
VASLSVEQVDPNATLFLRRLVLRPAASYEELAADHALPGTFAVAALVERVVQACAIALPEPLPEHPDRSEAWRIRGMAAHPDRRGEGLGTLVLDRLLAELRLRDARLVWCNARTPARRLYERAGFVVVGEPWDDPEIGPHVRMVRDL